MDHLWVFAVREWIRHQERKSVPFNQTVDSTMFQMVTEGLRDDKTIPNNFKQPINFAAAMGSRLWSLLDQTLASISGLEDKILRSINDEWIKKDEVDKVGPSQGISL